MAFDRKPDLDNANIGMPDTKILGRASLFRKAVERNGDIVPKAKYEEAMLEDGDSIEVVSFVGGG